MPHVVGELRGSALADLHALGLSVRELFVPDPGPGTHVTIRVYVNAQGGCF